MKKVFNVGETLDIYRFPETRSEYLGRGKLMKYVRTSMPILPKVSKVSEDLNLSYVLEYWIVSIEGKTALHGIMRPHKIGLAPSGVNTREQMDSEESVISEDFKILPGYDTSFWDSRVTGSELRSSMY